MRKYPKLLQIVAVLIFVFTSCELSEVEPEERNVTPKEETNWNGIIINGIKYPTPNAVIEIWGNNTDSLSSDYDLSFTDGDFDINSRQIVDNSILVYFDANSPSLENFSPGTYEIQVSDIRKPGNIVDAYILKKNPTTYQQYPILSGTVTVTEENETFKIDYTLQAIVNTKITKVTGKFEGNFEIIDQTALK